MRFQISVDLSRTRVIRATIFSLHSFYCKYDPRKQVHIT